MNTFIINLFHDLKLNNSIWIATCFFFSFVCNYKHRFCFTLGKARVILFWRSLHFYIISRIGKKKKKIEQLFHWITFFPSIICCINLGFFNISFSPPPQPSYLPVSWCCILMWLSWWITNEVHTKNLLLPKSIYFRWRRIYKYPLSLPCRCLRTHYFFSVAFNFNIKLLN